MAVALKEGRKLTLEDWLALPEGPPFYELENGELVKMPSPRREHQRLLHRLATFLDDFVSENELGTIVMEVDVALPTGEGYIPDIAFISREREEELLAPDGKVHGSPDLVVEVMSPTTRRRDRFVKFRNYWRAKVKWLWLVDAEELTVEEYEWTEGGYLCVASVDAGETFEPKALPGLKLNLSEMVKPRTRRGRRGRKRGKSK